MTAMAREEILRFSVAYGVIVFGLRWLLVRALRIRPIGSRRRK